MNILITGALGFVGSNISKNIMFLSKHYLIAIDVNNRENHHYNEFHFWNDWSKINLKSIDIMIHLAGKVHDTNNTSSEKEYFDINVGLTEKIFQYFMKSSASKFIFFSSVKAIADSVKGVLAEDAIPDPQTPYGKSKLEAEKYILSQSLQSGKKVYILRPCMIHGSGNKGNLNLLYKLAQKGIPWPLGAFENKRSFTSIDNLTFIIQQLIEKDIEPGIYQIADDEPISTNDLIKLIAASRNKKAIIWNIPHRFITISAKIGDFLHLPLNSERLKKLTESYVVSNKKIKNALGIDKMPVSAIDGFKKTFKSFQKTK